MPNAEIITIGTEILLGEIIDTNATFIAKALRENGIDLYRKTSVGDNKHRIAEVIKEALGRCDIVITTGGLGPTVDDPTRDAVALAVGCKTKYVPELWEQIKERFQRYNRFPTDNNIKQAYIPETAQFIENPVGTSPCFLVEIQNKAIISLPGVPKEMEYLVLNSVLPYLRKRFPGAGYLAMKTIHTAGAGESQIDELIGEYEIMENPTVGLAAHSGQIDVRIVAKAVSEIEANKMIETIASSIREKLSPWIYGENEQTLEQVTLENLKRLGWNVAIVEAGLNGVIAERLGHIEDKLDRNPFTVEILEDDLSSGEVFQKARQAYDVKHADIGLGISLIPGENKQDLSMFLITPEGEKILTRSYGGPPTSAPTWAANLSIYQIFLIVQQGC